MKNQALIVLDSLRWDVFVNASAPFLKSFPNSMAHTHGTYTLPCHEAFFTGKLPHTFQGRFDTCARSFRSLTGNPWWRLNNPESDGKAKIKLAGRNIVDGFNKKGFTTIGTGAVGWFNPNKPACIRAVKNFKHFGWFGEFTVARKQLDFVVEKMMVDNSRKFVFINFGETHHSYRISIDDKPTDWGDGDRCRQAQRRCLEYLNGLLEEYLSLDVFKDTNIIVCSDHGDCMGENGLWGHSFFHRRVMEVPIVEIHL